MPEQPERTDRTWCTSCRLVALNGSGDRNSHHLCAGRGQDGSGLCACSIPGCHLPRELAITPASSDDNWWCRTCVLWHPKDMGASPAEAHAEWERRVADRANRPADGGGA